MKRKLFSLFLALSLSVGLVSCGTKETVQETKNIKVVVPDGLPSMGMAKLIKENPEVKKGYAVEYSIEKTPETLLSEVLKGSPDIAIVPSNAAATAYNKETGYKIAGTIGWGSFYLLSSEGEKSLDELKGKEIYNIGRGLTPDIILKTLLKDRGVDIDKDYVFSYVNSAADLPPVVLSGKAKYAVLPEPALTTVLTKNKDLKVIADLNELWKKAYNSEFGFPQATVIVKESLIKDDKEFVENFLSKIDESVKFAYENRDELANYSEEIGISANKAIIPKAMDKANLKFVPIYESREEYENYFSKLAAFDPKTIGGKLPDEGIYMEK